MHDFIALPLILALTMMGYVILMWVVRMTNARADEILSGVVNGIPATKKTRTLMLYTQYLPYAAFGDAFVAIMALGVLEIARGVDDPRVAAIGYICATFFGTSALFIAVLVPFLFLNIRAALRQTR